MRLVRAVKHIGQNAEKFRFDLRIENLHIFLHEECEIYIDWIRGPKRISGKESVSCVNGSIIRPFYEPMVLIATLFQKSSHKSGKSALKDTDFFLPKDSRLVIYGKFKDNPLSLVVGEVPLDLSYYANYYKSNSENIDPIRTEIPLIKSSDPNSYIEIYITCLSLGQVSEGLDDTASMMSGFTTVYTEIADSSYIKVNEFKINSENNLRTKIKSNRITESKIDDKISNEFSLGIPMFSIKEDSESQIDNFKETEEMTETGTIVDVEIKDNLIPKDKLIASNNVSNSIPTYYPNPIIKLPNDSSDNIIVNEDQITPLFSNDKILSRNIEQNYVKSYSPPSSSSFEILTQRLYMEQEEYKRKINEYNMEIKSLKQQLQIYSEQEKSWKQREADLMNEIKQLRINEDIEPNNINAHNNANKNDNQSFNIQENYSKNLKVVDLNDYCLLQQEVSELTGIRDELRRLRESDKYKYEKYISQLENQLEDVKKQLDYYQKNGQLQDEVEAELFSIPKHPTSYATATSHASEYISTNRNTISSINITNNLDQKSKQNDYDNNNNNNQDNHLKFSYGYEEIEKELISTKLALAQTETNYQIEINNLKSRIDKQKKQLLSYSSYVGNLEVINADLKYKDKNNETNKIIDENSIQNNDKTGIKVKNSTSTINSYWKSFKQKIK